ncbi:MAG: hypothetical protein K0S56_380 [Microvirga sp.]|jgi:hypothetical protein|nr:hypothetical protein [Microvirga sp.]
MIGLLLLPAGGPASTFKSRVVWTTFSHAVSPNTSANERGNFAGEGHLG